MSSSRKKKRKVNRSALQGGTRSPWPVAAVLVVVLVVISAVWWYTRPRDDALPPAAALPASSDSAIPTPSAVDQTTPTFQQLIGRWMRTDGGYIVEILKAEPDGKLEASYFNPKPINVAKAEASLDGESVKVFIELRDDNYPGSTYTLFLSSDRNHLRGKYFQAVAGATYAVEFVRQ